MKTILLVICNILGLLYISNSYAVELYAKNTVGGYITLTDAPCQIPYLKMDYNKKTYFTNGENEYREGCYTILKTKKELAVIVIEAMGKNSKDNASVFSYTKFKSVKD